MTTIEKWCEWQEYPKNSITDDLILKMINNFNSKYYYDKYYYIYSKRIELH